MSLAKKKGSDAQRLDRSAFDVANRAFFRLYQASNLLHKVGTRYVSDFSATTQQWAVMGALARPFDRGRGMTVKDLIEFLMVTRQNITPLLDRLEERGWVERVKDPEDGRSRRLRLTPQGTSAWQDMQTPIAEPAAPVSQLADRCFLRRRPRRLQRPGAIATLSPARQAQGSDERDVIGIGQWR